jgi:alpha-amylase
MAETFSLAWHYGFTKVMSSFHFTDVDAGPPADSAGNILPVTINPDGSCGNGWVCEHRWNSISNMIEFQTVVAGTRMENWWANGLYQIAYSRGNLGFVAFNTASYDLHATIQTGLAPGVYCDVVSGARVRSSCTGETITVNSNGMAAIHVSATGDFGAVAIHAQVSYFTIDQWIKLNFRFCFSSFSLVFEPVEAKHV